MSKAHKKHKSKHHHGKTKHKHEERAELPDISEIQTSLCEGGLREFVEKAWHIVEPHAFVPGWHIDAICEHLEAVTRGQIRDLLINIAPRHAKSLLVSVFWPAWEWGPAGIPESRWLYMSYSSGLSLRDAVKARLLIQSPWYQKQWGYRYKLMYDQKAKSRYNNDKNGYRVSSSIGGMGTGEGGDRLVIDDPHNVKDVESDVIRQSVIDWYDNVMPTRLNDPKRSANVAIMQRSSYEDLSGHIKDMMGTGCEYLILPTEYEKGNRCRTSIGWKDPRRKEGELIWPERFGKPEVKKLKVRMGTQTFAAQCQQRPTPLAGGIILKKWFRYYNAYPLLKNVLVFQSWDMAFKALATSSYVAGQVWALIGSELYLLDRVREHLTFTESVKAIEDMTIKWPTSSFKFVEDAANGPAVLDTLKKKIPGLVGVKAEGSKESRAFAITPELEAGNVLLPTPLLCPWVEEYVDLMGQFPRSPHKDDVDATTQAIIQIRRRITNMSVNLPDIISMTRTSPVAGMGHD